VTDKHDTKYNTLISEQSYDISMPGGQFSHIRDKMSLARDTGHRVSIPGRSRPFRDGWQPYGRRAAECKPGKVVYIHVPLSSSSIIWYRVVMLGGWGGNRGPGGK